MKNRPDVDAIERSFSGDSSRYGVLARVKNECDIVEAFVRHHAALVDRVVVVDNASQDGTRGILDALEAEGLPLTVLSDDTLEYRQSEIMSYLSRACLRVFDIDRLFLLDADEFLHVESRSHIDAALSRFRSDESVRLAWATYVPETSADDGICAPLRMRRRRREEPKPSYKLAVSRHYADSPAAQVSMGNHDLLDAGTIVETSIADIRIAHYPIRSALQLQTKAAVSWTAYMAMGYDGAYGAQWKFLRQRSDEQNVAELRELAYGYPFGPELFGDDDLVDDPLPHSWSLRYEERARPNPQHTVAMFAEQIASRYAQLRGELATIRPLLQTLEARIGELEEER